ncbi:hypothetical protein [Ovoidimarina sediminis]|uniref:hypothetical protein n=1 Tax=Ovoidimarina sediminis TaxID=3079856 RepID=UPI002908252B|nr:hypothetical protein [Rhodophyticola sp. MJ-SS7]MDU8943048.1 hypothetical protein [Rhodophyticola sp. MJ-SS7]
MAGAGQFGSIDAACDFVKDWCGVRTEHPWRTSPEPGRFPDPLHRLGHRLDALWETRDHPYWTLPDQAHTVPLFEAQEHIFDPRDRRTLEGIACVIAENQGLYTLGYPTDAAPCLHVCGDWFDGGATDRWRPVPGTTLEQALILHLLGNLFWPTYPTVGSAEERALEP